MPMTPQAVSLFFVCVCYLKKGKFRNLILSGVFSKTCDAFMTFCVSPTSLTLKDIKCQLQVLKSQLESDCAQYLTSYTGTHGTVLR